MYAQFFETEDAARAALATWAEGVRGDWTVDRPREVIRMGGNPWTEGSVSPALRSLVQGRPLRLIRAEARGPFARSGGDNQGTSTAVLEVCFPQVENPLRKRSLAELDDVIEEVIARNPDWVKKINQIVEKSQRVKTISNV
jgi:hypothetical protein